jgi:ABC-type sugar transport system permease subunit
MGYASAVTVVLLVLTMALAVLQLTLLSRKVEY